MVEAEMMGNGEHSAEISAAAIDELNTREAAPVAHWQALALRRLSLLVTAEHDVSMLRTRLDMVQSERQALMRERSELSRELDEQLLRIRRLENEQAALLASKSWRITAPLRRASKDGAYAKARLRTVLRRLIANPMARPVVRLIVRLLPGLSLRLRTRLHAK
jgi:hypothetical protein